MLNGTDLIEVGCQSSQSVGQIRICAFVCGLSGDFLAGTGFS